MSTNEEVRIRRSHVLAYVLQGVSQGVIAREFNISIRTVANDIAAMRKKIREQLNAMDAWDRLVDYNKAQEMRIRKFWMIINNPKEPTKNVLKALTSLRDEEILQIKKDQIAGILPKEREPMPVLIKEEKTQGPTDIYQTLLKIKQAEEEINSEFP